MLSKTTLLQKLFRSDCITLFDKDWALYKFLMLRSCKSISTANGSWGDKRLFVTRRDVLVVGHLSTEHLSKSSIKSAKVAIKMVIISGYFGKKLMLHFTLILNENKNNVF